MKIEISQPVSEESSNTEFHEKPPIANRVVECGQTDTTILIVVSHNFANAPKNNTANCVLHDLVYRGVSRRSFPFKIS